MVAATVAYLATMAFISRIAPAVVFSVIWYVRRTHSAGLLSPGAELGGVVATWSLSLSRVSRSLACVASSLVSASCRRRGCVCVHGSVGVVIIAGVGSGMRKPLPYARSTSLPAGIGSVAKMDTHHLPSC